MLRPLRRATTYGGPSTASDDRPFLAPAAGRRALGGGDFDSLLLTGVGHVGNGGTLHVAFPPQIVEIGTSVHGAAIVPHDEIVHPPPMGIDELPLVAWAIS